MKHMEEGSYSRKCHFLVLRATGIHLSNPQAVREHAFAIFDGSLNDTAFGSSRGACSSRPTLAVDSTNISYGPIP